MATARNSHVLRIIPLTLIVALLCSLVYGKAIYVDDDAAGANNGSSWADAYRCLQNALADAQSGDEIRVAEGIYKPDRQLGTERSAGIVASGDRTASFQLKNGVTIKGGYAGFGQLDPDARDIELYKSTLSGDLDGNDGPNFTNNGDNSTHVVTGSGTNATAMLDGFNISAGNAIGSNPSNKGGGMYCESGSPTISNCTFSGNSGQAGGGGMYNSRSSPSVSNCRFSENSARSNGGAIVNYNNSSPMVVGCIFSGNSAGEKGGGMWNNARCSPTVINCTFSGNSATWGGGVGHEKSNSTLINCTFSGNTASAAGGAVFNLPGTQPLLANCILWSDTPEEIHGSTLVITYSDIQGGWPGEGNIDADPLFVDAANANYHLQSGSPCIGAGDNSAIPQSVVVELDGNPNIVNGTVDMGACKAIECAIARTEDRISLPPKQTVQLKVPTLLSPVEGAELDNGRTDQLDAIAWDFDWSDVAGATEYHLYVTGEGARNPVINRQGLTHSSYHHARTRSYVTNRHRFGWTWKVRAKTGGQWGEWSPTRSFYVEPANTDPPPLAEAHLRIPEQMQACAANLQKIRSAIKKYEEDRGKLPDWLSDLVPDYLSNEVLFCPNDAEHVAQYSPDPKLPCSYSWQFSAKPIPTGWDPTGRTLYRDWKAQQVKLFGDVVPMIRCSHHDGPYLNLSVGGQIWWGQRDWEYMFKPNYRFGDESPKQQSVIQPVGQLRIDGVARDEAGKPLARVKLQVLPMSRGEATSDSQGRFEIGWDPRRLGSRETVHYLVARQEERNLAVAVEVAEEIRTLDLRLKPGVTFTGEVVDPDGKGISNARIMVMLRVTNWGSTLGRGRVVTNATGKFEVRAIPQDHKYSVTASAEGFGQNATQIHAEDAEYNHLDVGKLTLPVADLSVSGVVVDADDKPVAGARIFCYGEGQTPSRAQTDAQGKFTLENICAGMIRISASVSGETRLSGYVQTEGGATDIKIVATERPSSVRYVPRPPRSLNGKLLPDLRDVGIELSAAEATDKMVLVCFWDMEQRPSRYCMRELIKQAEELKGKDVIVVAVQASQVDRGALDKWIKENNTPFPVGMIHEDAERVRLAWGVKSLPWLILTDRKHIVRVGNFGLAELGEKIEIVISQPLQEWSAAADEWKPPENPDPHEILHEAQADARAQHYEEALAKHVWFHRNALKYEPALSGVRSSFALSYWHELGRIYPPALVKLKEIRDEAEESVRNGKHIRESFGDARSINREVGEESRTKDLFILLDAQNADAAKEVFHFAQPALINAKEYKLCGKYIDPRRSFPWIIERFRIDRRLAKDPRFGADHLDFANKKFTNDATTLVALLVVNGRKAEAEEIAGDAKKEWDNASFHAEIDKALQGSVPKPWP